MLKHIALLVIFCVLVACTSPQSSSVSITQSNKKTADDAFLIELQNNKEELKRLVSMEQDLKVLIAALSEQSDLQNLPASLRIKPKIEQHKIDKSLHLKTSQTKEAHGFKLSLQPVFSESSAQAQLTKVYARLPKLDTFLSSAILEQTHRLQSRFVPSLKIVKNRDDANKLCALINNIGVLCTVEESR
ncbi:hypothetical protein C1E24_09805 [Pseudoalteromonas phenolica]|uniref:SPOR domain-containing protein n=1 Tax=Pseudoalteromonas phenolica TaxID=161398 RepID=A0A5R9Q1Q0_9GAMM|nr:hypothetical protein [Pseudoalteromonas phenolica]TLX47090.1 hypothetical protein C1E24_09805 [Pseudoalteromonas phenolica]